MTDKEKNLIDKLVALQEQSENEYYKNAELNRHSFLKEKMNFSEKEIDENEIKSKKNYLNFF